MGKFNSLSLSHIFIIDSKAYPGRALVFPGMQPPMLVTSVIICSPKDVDECATDVDNCEHNCSNNNGSYTCTCRQGYRLHSNGRQCDGKHTRKCIPLFLHADLGFNEHRYQ